MCCNATKQSTLWLKKLMEKNGGKMTFWKIIYTDGRSYYKPYYWDIGHHVAEVSRKPNWNRQDTSKIKYGFHVYLDKNRTIYEVRDLRAFEEISLLEVECDVKDLLGAETNSFVADNAAFSEVRVTKTGWKKFQKTTKAYNRRIRK